MLGHKARLTISAFAASDLSSKAVGFTIG